MGLFLLIRLDSISLDHSVPILLDHFKDFMKQNNKLKKELEELKKENLFLKKAAAFFAKEID